MCGRYYRKGDKQKIADAFHAKLVDDGTPSPTLSRAFLWLSSSLCLTNPSLRLEDVCGISCEVGFSASLRIPQSEGEKSYAGFGPVKQIGGYSEAGPTEFICLLGRITIHSAGSSVLKSAKTLAT